MTIHLTWNGKYAGPPLCHGIPGARWGDSDRVVEPSTVSVPCVKRLCKLCRRAWDETLLPGPPPEMRPQYRRKPRKVRLTGAVS